MTGNDRCKAKSVLTRVHFLVILRKCAFLLGRELLQECNYSLEREVYRQKTAFGYRETLKAVTV